MTDQDKADIETIAWLFEQGEPEALLGELLKAAGAKARELGRNPAEQRRWSHLAMVLSEANAKLEGLNRPQTTPNSPDKPEAAQVAEPEASP